MVTTPEQIDASTSRRRRNYVRAAIEITVILLAMLAVNPMLRPVVCPDCSEPYRPYSTSCGDTFNPTTAVGGGGYPTCSL